MFEDTLNCNTRPLNPLTRNSGHGIYDTWPISTSPLSSSLSASKPPAQKSPSLIHPGLTVDCRRRTLPGDSLDLFIPGKRPVSSIGRFGLMFDRACPRRLCRLPPANISILLCENHVYRSLPSLFRHSQLYPTDDGDSSDHARRPLWMPWIPCVQLLVFLDGFTMGSPSAQPIFSIFSCICERGMHEMVAWKRHSPPLPHFPAHYQLTLIRLFCKEKVCFVRGEYVV